MLEMSSIIIRYDSLSNLTLFESTDMLDVEGSMQSGSCKPRLRQPPILICCGVTGERCNRKQKGQLENFERP